MPPTTPLFLAHAGPGASWQAVVTIICLGLGVLFVAVVAGWFEVREPGDLLLPVAAVVIVAGLGTGVSETVSDWVGWALPVGVVAVGALLIGAMTAAELRPGSRFVWASVAAGVVLTLVLAGPLTEALHPPEDTVAGTDAAAPHRTAHGAEPVAHG